MSLVDSPGVRGDRSLQGKVVLVTGAAGGIGSAVALRMFHSHAHVVGTDLRAPPSSWPSESENKPAWWESDLSHAGAAEQLVFKVIERYQRIDAVVHCVGITDDRVLWKLEPDQWSSVLRTNLDSAFYLLKACAPSLRSNGGSVVLLSSINAERGKFGQSNYCASKAGLVALGKTAARELGRFGVRVNSVLPGFVRTPMTATLEDSVIQRAQSETVLGKVADPEDIADVVWFLCSDLSRHMTGQSLRVDGGQLIA